MMNTWLGSVGWQFAGAVTLVLLLAAAAWVDVRDHRIPNALIFSGVALALMLAHLPGGSVGRSLAGIAVGMGITLPLYWLRAMGAGDVKLMGMVGSFLGGGDTVAAALVVFLIGGLLSLATVARLRAFSKLGGNIKQMVLARLLGCPLKATAPDAHGGSVGVVPYGVAIAAGTIIYLFVLKGGPFQ